jgi:hypothetical protein
MRPPNIRTSVHVVQCFKKKDTSELKLHLFIAYVIQIIRVCEERIDLFLEIETFKFIVPTVYRFGSVYRDIMRTKGHYF